MNRNLLLTKMNIGRFSIIRIISLVLILFPLSGCSNFNEISQDLIWHYEDLRAIDPVDAEFADMDIIAAYIKDVEDTFCIRLDLLQLDIFSQQTIIIGLDFEPNGSNSGNLRASQISNLKIQWDVALLIPVTGMIRVYNSSGDPISGAKVRVFRDSAFDFITIKIDKRGLLPENSPVNVEVFISDTPSKQIFDRVGPINSRALPPPPARVIFGFYNTFLASTPAQALRMWDGAHAGPMSSRHGLNNLINSATEAGVKVNLVDVCSLVSKSGLSFLGVYEDIVKLWRRQELDLCYFEGYVCLKCVGDNGYANNGINYNENPPLDIIITKLVDAALSGDNIYVLIDFSKSAWGNPTISADIFEYIKNHQWIVTSTISSDKNSNIHKSNAVDRSITIKTTSVIDEQVYEKFINQYYATPENTLKELAEQSFIAVSHPANTQAMQISTNYFQQLGHILAAADWYDDPYAISNCEIDLDWDEHNECIISSENFFITFELTGGYLAFAFYKNSQGIHQIIAPMSEVVVGLEAPSAYNLDNGVFSDPRLIPGVLTNFEERNYVYKYRITKNEIKLFSEELGTQKSFRFSDYNIQISWGNANATGYSIPFALDPWQRFNANWSDQYFTYKGDNYWEIGISNQISIQIQSYHGGQFNTFLDSRKYLGTPEDPNFDYPAGHYLPFPFSTLTIPSTKSNHIDVEIIDTQD